VKPYRVGIDLGTSNTVVAYAAPGDERIELLPIDQLVGPGEVAARPLLPSARYHPAPGELSPDDLQLPWPAVDVAGAHPVVIGSLARELGAQVPGRIVTSAKSWLSHAGVDRMAPILPWGAGNDVAKVSPVGASASYLSHVRAAWNVRFPDAPLERQEVVLTVPASFDEGARALTLEAARIAKLPALRLLEEPQAACYDWLFRHRQRLAAELEDTRLILVCDVGGGTTDFTLIQVAIADGMPQLTRIGVGDHLMLGGDNMDLALAHVVEGRLGAADGRLSASRFSQLLQRCRAAKEALLASAAPERTTVTLLGAGSRLVGGARSVELARDDVERLIVDGFLPRVAPTERPARRRAGIVEFGLPYPADPAITRHLAAFLDRHATASRAALGDDAPGPDELPVPDTVLLNGGVFRAAALSERLQHALGAWRGALPRLLHNDNPDVAVARGAVAYALVREQRGLRIGGGSPRSYFLVVEGDDQSRRGICVLPRGTEEGREVPLPDRSFALKLGQPVQFHLVSSAADTPHRAGDLIDVAGEDFVRLPPIATVVPSAGAGALDVPVRIVATMTEVGTLDMRCVSIGDAARRWLLAFALRSDGAPQVGETLARLPPRFADAIAAIDRVFGSRAHDIAAKEVRQLRGQLDHLLGKREGWELPLLRALFDALWERVRRRRRSAEHERLWLNLAGYCVRPGLGYPLDDWRVEQLWTLFEQGIQYVRERQNWSEWWTLWRRAAGGLAASEQLLVLQAAGEQIEAEDAARRAHHPVGTKGSLDDLVRLTASLERVAVEHRIEIGEWLIDRLQKPSEKQNGWWAVGRLGAREPLYASAHDVVPADVAARWLDAILALDWKRVEPAAFAAAQIARMTGDRARDLPPALRDEVVRRLEAINAPPSWTAMVREVVVLEEAEKWRAFGESLPAGLHLLDT
jgi:molecular chaperone DnaK (HSP70)